MYDTIFDDFNIIKQHCKRNGNISFDESAVFELLENLFPQYGSTNSIHKIIDMLDMQRIKDCKDTDSILESLDSDKSNDADSIVEVEVPPKSFAVIDLTENSAESDEPVYIKSENPNVDNIGNDVESIIEDNDSTTSYTDNGLLSDYDSRNFDDDSNLANGPPLLEYLALLEQPSCAISNQFDGDQSNAGTLEMLEENNNDPNNNLGDRAIEFAEEPVNANSVIDHDIIRQFSNDSENSNSSLHRWDEMIDPIPGCSKDTDSEMNANKPVSPKAGCSKDFDIPNDSASSDSLDEEMHKDATCIQEIISWADMEQIRSLLKRYRLCPNRKQIILDNLINQESINAISKRKSEMDNCTIVKKSQKLELIDDIEETSLDLLFNLDSDTITWDKSSDDLNFLKTLQHTFEKRSSDEKDLNNHTNEQKDSGSNRTLLNEPLNSLVMESDQHPVVTSTEKSTPLASSSTNMVKTMEQSVKKETDDINFTNPINRDHNPNSITTNAKNPWIKEIDDKQKCLINYSKCSKNNVENNESKLNETLFDKQASQRNPGICKANTSTASQAENPIDLKSDKNEVIKPAKLVIQRQGLNEYVIKPNALSTYIKPATFTHSNNSKAVSSPISTTSWNVNASKSTLDRCNTLRNIETIPQQCQTMNHKIENIPLRIQSTKQPIHIPSLIHFKSGKVNESNNSVVKNERAKTTWAAPLQHRNVNQDNNSLRIPTLKSQIAAPSTITSSTIVTPKLIEKQSAWAFNGTNRPQMLNGVKKQESNEMRMPKKIILKNPAFFPAAPITINNRPNYTKTEPTATITSASATITSASQSAPIKITEAQPTSSGTQSVPATRDVPDRAIYDKLRSIFPEVKSSYVKKICIAPPKTVNSNDNEHILNILIDHLLTEGPNHLRSDRGAIEEQNIASLSVDEKYENLLQIFPDADPTYLREFVEKNHSEQDYQQFVQQKLESRDYPTKEQYMARIKITEQIKQYTSDFSVEKFLEIFPDPFKYFEDKKRICTHQPIAMEFLKSMFSKNKVLTISRMYAASRYNLSIAAKKLTELGPDMKSKRVSSEMPTENIPLIQEMAFLKNKTNIENHLHMLKVKEEQLFKELKERNSLLTCQCCYNDECMPTKSSECNKGHSFCHECIIRGTESTLADGEAHVRCFTDCQGEIPLATLQTVLAPTKFSALLKKRQAAEVLAAAVDGLVSCPFCHFASIPPPEDKVFKCLNPECMKETCRQCKELNHVPLKCDEVIKTDKARRLIEEKMTEALIRTCYRCKKQFYKEDGCNKMKCSCGALMCYLCDKPIESYNHFNAQGGANTHLCPLWSDDRLMNAKAVIKVAEEMKNALLKDNPHLKIDTEKLLPKLPPKTKGPHDDIPNADQLPEHVLRLAGAAP